LRLSLNNTNITINLKEINDRKSLETFSNAIKTSVPLEVDGVSGWLYWTCSITRLVIEQVSQNAPHFAVF
jgi:hypothetical protein